MSFAGCYDVEGLGRIVLDETGLGTLFTVQPRATRATRRKRATNRKAFEQRVLADYDFLERTVWSKTESVLLQMGDRFVARLSSRSRRMKKVEKRETVLTQETIDKLFEQIYDHNWTEDLVAWLELQFEQPINDTILYAVTSTAAALGLALDLGPGVAVRDALMGRANQLAGEVAETTYSAVKRAMLRGIDEGLSTPDISDLIRQVFIGTSRSRATTIARTEVVSSYNAAVQAAGSLSGLITGYEWLATADARTRRSHALANGQRILPGETFQVGASQLKYPGDPAGSGKEVINCVVGDTEILRAGQDVLAATSRMQFGAFVDLRTAHGHELTVTANHPVLTLRGYVPAAKLQPGDKLVCATGSELPQVRDAPSRADELYAAVRERNVEERVVGPAVQFHGDVSDQKVDVVRADRMLPRGSRQEIRKRVFVALRDGTGPLSRSGNRVGSSAAVLERPPSWPGDGRTSFVVGSPRERSSLAQGHLRHSDLVGFGPGSDGQAKLSDPGLEYSTTDTESVRHLQDADALGMHVSDLVEIHVYSAHRRVYNFQTERSWYIGNGIMLHNCRCVMLPLTIDEWDPSKDERSAEVETRGDFNGHPFRGNQWTKGGGAGVQMTGRKPNRTVTYDAHQPEEADHAQHPS